MIPSQTFKRDSSIMKTSPHSASSQVRMFGFSGGVSLAALFTLLLLIPSLAFADGARDSVKTRAPKQAEKKADNSIDANEIVWRNYEDGLQLAKEQGKQILIDFSTAWCGYCKKMERETFKDASVIDFVNSNFVAIKVDGDSKREIELDGFTTTEKRLTNEMYGVRGYPTFWFLEPDGAKIGKQPGYQPAKSFLELLSYVNEKKYIEPSAGSAPKSGQ